jgi:hypothetical protein
MNSHIMSPIESQIMGIRPVFFKSKVNFLYTLVENQPEIHLGLNFLTFRFESCLRKVAVKCIFSFKFSY